MNEVKIISTAKLAHEANKTWCEINGDFSQENWKRCQDWQRESAINGVKFHLENPDAGDSASHDSWMDEKVNAGWEYGEIKDPDANPPTHPCIVPFEELPEVQQKKDSIFRSIVHATLSTDNNKKSKGFPIEEMILSILDTLPSEHVDKRWLDIGRTHIEQGFMAINRAISEPSRVDLD